MIKYHSVNIQDKTKYQKWRHEQNREIQWTEGNVRAGVLDQWAAPASHVATGTVAHDILTICDHYLRRSELNSF